jgi:hypothetical protein
MPGDVPPGLDGAWLDGHDRVAGLQRPVDQAAVGPLDCHWQRGRVVQPAEPGHSRVNPSAVWATWKAVVLRPV